VSLVAILDADQEGFLRSDRSLIQTVGRAARHVNGRAIFYADKVTDSMQRCIDETSRRRATQVEWNAAHGIVPQGVVKSVSDIRFITRVADAREEREAKAKKVAEADARWGAEEYDKKLQGLEAEMRRAAEELDFESAARLRDEVFELRAARDRASNARKRDAFADIRAGR
jgi:excinuclease ABC subunit B